MEIFTTPTTKYYKNGQIAFQSRHDGDLIIINEWWENGKKLRECCRDRKTLKFVGMRKEYDGDGNIDIELPYDNQGNVDGIQRKYYPNGNVMCEMFYKNRKLIRTVNYYY